MGKDIKRADNDLRGKQSIAKKDNIRAIKEQIKERKNRLNDNIQDINNQIRQISKATPKNERMRKLEELKAIKKELMKKFKAEENAISKKGKVRDKIIKSIFSSKLRKSKKSNVSNLAKSAPIYNPSYSTIPMSKIKFVGDYQKGKARASKQERKLAEPDYAKGVVSFKEYLNAGFNIPEIQNISMLVGDSKISTNIENLLDENGRLTNFVKSEFVVDFLQNAKANNIVLTKADGTPVHLSNLNTISRREIIEKVIKDSQGLGFTINGEPNNISFSTFLKQDGNRFVVTPLTGLVNAMSETEISEIIIKSETCLSAFKDGRISNLVRNNAGEYVPIDEASSEEIDNSNIDAYSQNAQNSIANNSISNNAQNDKINNPHFENEKIDENYFNNDIAEESQSGTSTLDESQNDNNFVDDLTRESYYRANEQQNSNDEDNQMTN